MAYWWVNHNKTFEQEFSGGYMWSPKTNQNGAKSHFYDNMTRVIPGDMVFSYAGGKIKAVGIATGTASSAAKPSEFDAAGENWGNQGWFVPVEFKLLPRPLRPKDHLSEIVPLLPDKYSPIQKNGNGNQVAYLSSISPALVETLQILLDADEFFDRLQGVGSGEAMEAANDAAEDRLKADENIADTEKEQLVKARRGQGVFKSNVEMIESGCRVTGLQLREHLRASHIKPWRVSNNIERLDGNNGLLLAPHVDHLFDRGFISFTDSGDLLVSEKLDPAVLKSWAINRSSNVGQFSQEQQEYLQYHRLEVFQH